MVAAHQYTGRIYQRCSSDCSAVGWIAQLGGFLGRKSDGEPGITTIWRGWQRLQDIAATWYLVRRTSIMLWLDLRKKNRPRQSPRAVCWAAGDPGGWQPGITSS
jgi:hypothetical protein